MGVIILVTLFPFWWSLRTALSSNRALASSASSFAPADFSWGGFRRALGVAKLDEALAEGGSGASINFLRNLRNSVIVSTMITVGQVGGSAMAAYAFARLRFPGRDKLFLLFLTALMIPPIFTFLPNFVLIKNLGLLNTYLGIAAPTLLMTPFAVFFMRQFFLGIPREVEEAATIDGAGRLQVFFRVVLPMAAAPLATLALLVFVESWNAYLWPKLVGADESVRVLTAALGAFRSQTPQNSPDWSGLMAATWVAALPIMILLVASGRRLVNSIQFSGIK
jgi:multiple sugar transport system permease protein